MQVISPRPPTAPGIFCQHQQRCRLGQGALLSTQFALQHLVLALQCLELGLRLAPLLRSLRVGAAAKGFAPWAQLMLEQALLATPGVQGLTAEAMAFLQGQQTLSGAPLAGPAGFGEGLLG